MATLRLAQTARTGQLTAISAAIDAGGAAATLELYTGTIPTNADTAVGAQVLLGVCTFSYPCAASVTLDTLTFDTITGDSSADATGTATWGRVKTSAAATVFDGTVTVTGGGGVFQLTNTSITATQPITPTSGVITAPVT